MVVHISNPRTQEVRRTVCSQSASGILSESETSLSFLVRSCHKKERKKGKGKMGRKEKGRKKRGKRKRREK